MTQYDQWVSEMSYWQKEGLRRALFAARPTLSLPDDLQLLILRHLCPRDRISFVAALSGADTSRTPRTASRRMARAFPDGAACAMVESAALTLHAALSAILEHALWVMRGSVDPCARVFCDWTPFSPHPPVSCALACWNLASPHGRTYVNHDYLRQVAMARLSAALPVMRLSLYIDHHYYAYSAPTNAPFQIYQLDLLGSTNGNVPADTYRCLLNRNGVATKVARANALALYG